MVWNVSLGSGTPLLCAHGHGVNIVRWSHNSFYLFAGAFTNKVFIWETRSWRCESWSLSKGMCQCATWSPDGELIVFAETGTSSLWTLALHHIPPRIDGLLMKIKLDVGILWDTDRKSTGKSAENEGVRSEKKILFMREGTCLVFRSTRPTFGIDCIAEGTRAGRGLDDAPATLPGDELIVIYNVFFRPKLRFSPSGFLRSSADAGRPYNIHFWPACRNGALLASAWANGMITVYPLLYRSPSNEE